MAFGTNIYSVVPKKGEFVIGTLNNEIHISRIWVYNEFNGNDKIHLSCIAILNCICQKWNKRGQWKNWLIENALLVQCEENVCMHKNMLAFVPSEKMCHWG